MRYSFCARAKQLCSLFLPVAAAQFLEIILEFINLVFAGHLGKPEYLAAMGFSITAANVLAFSILNGLSHGILTLGS